MNILTALLAFAVTMIVLSTMVTAIVQILHRFRNIRRRHLRLLVESYFDEVVYPRFSAALAQAPSRPDGDAAASAPRRTALQMLFNIILKFNDLWPKDKDGTPAKPRFRVAIIAFAVLVLLYLLYLLALLSFEAAILLLVVIGVLIPALRSHFRTLSDNGSKHGQMREQFVQDMTTIIGEARGQTGMAENISAVEFASRLARTGAGRAIAEKGAEKLEPLVTDLIRRFDSIGAGATASFAVMSRRWSLYVAFFVAFAANVDAVTLLQHFADNPVVAERVANMGPAAIAEHQAMDKTLKKELKNAEAEWQKAVQAGSNSGNDDAAEAKKEIEHLKDLIATTRKAQERQIAALAGAGVPIGWSYFPFCNGSQTPPVENAGTNDTSSGTEVLQDERCNLQTYEVLSKQTPEQVGQQVDDKDVPILESIKVFLGCSEKVSELAQICAAAGSVEGVRDWIYPRVWTDPGVFLGWLFGAILAGALVGLGGPFWFDVYRRLSVVAQMVRGLDLGAGKERQPAAAAEEAPKPPETAHQPKSAVDAFREALEADQALAQTGGARLLLAPDGTPLK